MLIPISIALSFFLAAAPAEPAPQGAKELFFNPIDGQISSVSPPPARDTTRPVKEEKKKVRSPEQKLEVVLLKDAVYWQAETPQRSIGLKHRIELRDAEGRSFEVTDEQRIFHSGERIQLHFRSNADGQIILLQSGTSGKWSVLFPDATKGVTDNRIAANEDRILPSDATWFRFDDKPGTERILALFAQSQEDLAPLPGSPERTPEAVQALLRTAEEVRGSKDLIVETETRNAAEIGTYGVNRAGKPVILEIVLRHE